MVIQQLTSDTFPVAALCEALNVSRSAFYAWQQERPTARRLEDNQLRPVIRSIFLEHRRRYGARRIAAELAARGQVCGQQRVGRLMKEMRLKAIQPRSFKPRTTDSRHALGYNPNLLINAPPPDGIDQLWVGDITYVPLVGGDFLYLALLLDCFSRRIIGWDIQDHMQQSLVLAALRMALARDVKAGLVHHSDRGGQYAGAQYRAILARAGMLQSMSRANNCYDNTFMESCFGTVKTELEMKPYRNAYIARKESLDYIRYYNTRRLHSSLGYMTPEAFEAEHRGS